ncbi:hypothetical protein Tco_1410011 [Tanacetum coccineum]
MQYRPAQSMPPSLTDAMRKFSIGTSTPFASVPVQPQPPMQQIAKTTTNTAVVSLPLVPSSSKLVKPSADQVTITPEVTSKTKCKHIMKCLIEQYKASHLGNHGFAYDGNKSAFAAGPLPFENKEFVIVVPEKDGRLHGIQVAVKFVVTKDNDQLRKRIIVGRSIFSSPLGNDMSNAQQAETGQSVIEEQALEIGSRKSVRKLFGSYDLLDLIKSYQPWKAKENQSCWRLLSPTSVAASELGLLKQTHTVSDLRNSSLATPYWTSHRAQFPHHGSAKDHKNVLLPDRYKQVVLMFRL